MLTTLRRNSTTTEVPPTPWTPQKLRQNDTWISLIEAQQLAHGEVEWWKCPNVNGEPVDFLQTPNPVWSNGSKMYVGGWQKHHKKAYFQWHGPGVYYRQDGRILVGTWVDGKLKGLTKRLWCPNAPCWQENYQAESVIKNADKQGVPFIYIGKYKGHWKQDHHAVVILKDGTTRRGPWKRNAPVGDWWNDHEKGYTSPEEMSRILGFSRIELPTITDEVAAANDEESQAPTVVVNNKTKEPVAVAESEPAPEPQVESHALVPPRKIYLEPDTSEPGEIMPGTALAHTMGEDDEEEIIFLQGDCMDDSVVAEQSQYDERTPLALSKQVNNMTDPLVSPISVHDDGRDVARHDLPQKLLFGHISDDVSCQEESERKCELNGKKSLTSKCEFDNDFGEEETNSLLLTEEVPSEYKELDSMKDLSSHTTRNDATALTKSFTASQQPPVSSDNHEISYNMDQLSALVDWLMVDVIGSDPSPAEMEQYARHFLNVGLHSSLMITSTCTTADAANFSWMKPFHRRCFVLWAHKNCENVYQRQLVSITTWLQFEVIGNDADILEMGYYARKLISVGFHSVQMILAVCNYDDVDAFDWMKPIHKRLFLMKTGIANSFPGNSTVDGNRSTV